MNISLSFNFKDGRYSLASEGYKLSYFDIPTKYPRPFVTLLTTYGCANANFLALE